MVRALFLSFFLLLMYSMRPEEKRQQEYPVDLLGGLWAEFWDEDPEYGPNNINYADTLSILAKENVRFQMSCTNRPHYTYDNLGYSNNTFSFRMENAYDPDDIYVLEYTVKWHDPNTLLGTVITNHGVKALIKLVRINTI